MYLLYQHNNITKNTLQKFNQVIIIKGRHIEYIKLVIIREPKPFHFNLPKDVNINLKHEIYSIIKYNELLAEHTIKNELTQVMPKYKDGIENLSIYCTWKNIRQQYRTIN